MSEPKEPFIEFTYTNYRGVVERRKVTPSSFFWGQTPHHPGVDQWMLSAYDHDRLAWRDFAFKDITWDQPWAIIRQPKRGFDAGDWFVFLIAALVGLAIGQMVVAAAAWWFS